MTPAFRQEAKPSGRRPLGAGLLAAALFLAPLTASSAGGRDVQLLAPGWGALDYEAPAPGSYRLPPLGEAADGEVVDTAGKTRRLYELFDGRIVLLAFIYSSCDDPNGCPLATAVMNSVYRETQTAPDLDSRMRLVSLSFDPARDTPERLGLYEKGVAGKPGGDWQFLTTTADGQLEPILEAYGQSVQTDPDGAFAHILRVFLIDTDKRIRNIYSASFLHRDLVLADARTLLLESGERPLAEVAGSTGTSRLSGAGDVKEGYESADYLTRSKSLSSRTGESADLLSHATGVPLGLPEVPVPADNPLTAARIELGRTLFFDRRLSLNDTFSCAMCHIPEQGFTSNEMATAVGIEGRTVRRNAPTLFNVAYAERLFHDGREHTLEQQVWSPLLAHNEMGNPSIGALLDKIARLPDYANRFEEAFGKGPGMETVGMALASYQRTLLAGDSPFDRWRYGGDADAVTDAAKRGFALFRGKAGCVACHAVGEDHALFTDHQMHNTGIGYVRAMGKGAKTRRVQVAPGVFIDVDREVIDSVGEPPPADLGLYEVTQNPEDRWKYRTPTLRNVALTAPYMHDGSISTLRKVVDFYDEGGVPNENLSALIRPLNLNDREKQDLVAFLESLTGGSVDLLVSDAFAARIGDLTRDDPHWSHGDTRSGE